MRKDTKKTIYNILLLTEYLENESRYGKPIPNARIWYWKDEIGNIGYLYAITEMEALDRLREAFTEVGCITWISEREFKKLN